MMLKYLKLLPACLHDIPCTLPHRSAADGILSSCTKAKGAILTDSPGKPFPLLHGDHKQVTCASTFSGLSWTPKTSVKGQSDNGSGGVALPELKFSEKQISATSYFLKIEFYFILKIFLKADVTTICRVKKHKLL